MRFSTLMKITAALALVSLPASATLLVNGNFDADPVANGTSTCNGASGATPGFTGWTSFGFSCGTGLHNPDSSQYPAGLVPSEENVAYHNGPAGFWQAASTYEAGVTYTFSILVGQRLDETYSGYLIELRAGTGTGTLLAFDANSGSAPAPGTFESRSISYTPGLGDPALGQSVVAVFRGGSLGTQTSFDNAELTASPEPGTYALLGSALVGLAALRRKRGEQPVR